jgi:hypothetical protein
MFDPVIDLLPSLGTLLVLVVGTVQISEGHVGTGDVVAAAFKGGTDGDIGALTAVFAVTGACYVLGGLLFGIATFRAGILSRWAAALLAVGNVATAALAVLPQSFNRPLAIPTGLALIGLGVSLWRDQGAASVTSATTTSATGRTEPVVSVR